ncbi:endonuclease/exonuclease/phosphatase family protein [Roseivirga sp. E12]|uniref:endonuclease/exonuclease/phosphatase family protein n=1 Tax=Roseivirga sp. E12 TaxID=2819237 RepID=UPI001ABC99A3|nr:endonuclease/exonuclease/phosphatase family protein [Roseivirga sp. E12]MBO3698152.1 endonuclease/exonuclease/phosphatase family protein [Roseivirga sp. E12]
MIQHRRIVFSLLLAVGLLSLIACDRQKTASLKIMSYNIKHGEGMDGVLDLSRAAAIIKAQAPDLCGLQEIDHYCSRTDSIGQTEVLAQETDMNGTFGKFMDYQGGEYGMATLSAKPLISTEVLRLPDGIHEPRSAIVHEVEIAKGCSIAFVNVHFDWINSTEGSASRLSQAKTLVEFLNTMDKAVIITGDFNCTPSSPTMQYFYSQGFEFAQKGEDNLSFQGGNKSEIDQVIYRSTGSQEIKVKSIVLLEEPLVSDHRPLVAQLEVLY